MTQYFSTRGDSANQNFTDVLLTGLAPDGGLYIPEIFPTLTADDLNAMQGKSYAEIAYLVTAPFVGDAIPEDVYKKILHEVYEGNFEHTDVAPLIELSDNIWIMELFHGPTLAFKDYALQLLGRLFDYVLEQKGERVTIVGATSGDTGSAAIEACKGCSNIDIFILHPEGRTSEVQRRQMTTIDAANVHNIALDGNFDDCQNMVKAMFNDPKFRGDINMSAVNSINWARIMAQIVYYVTTYVVLEKAMSGGAKQKISFAVPTGNFGNVYAAYAAKQMGLPIDRLIIGSNRNDILTRFFETGTMSAGAVEPSLSPSMDIQISSNFERYLCDLMDRDTDQINALMNDFKDKGQFSLSDEKMAKACETFSAYRCDDAQTQAMMKKCYEESGYMLDPHTAVGLSAGLQADLDLTTPLVALACAHPAKFPDAVEQAIGIRPDLPPHLADLYDRKEYVTSLPNDLTVVQDFVKTNIGL